ncbi:ABC transporter ATP-binding protein [Lamprobacter modestohalophilus]|uniref:ABC transporter ATP-binding protein n=1 Tax=Lamprobacter modestohalophilus TaxID=1064514 RepID=UPI002ADEB66E|nr:ABC transporter ATP-binding protein [Lamprobacter modestohalophilus]MEA1051481.1 ABC transporter ATP-binding protein [Lamprobacter modestohalophilus]
MSSEQPVAIRATQLSKTYRVFKHPLDRVRQLFSQLRKRTYYTPAHALDGVSFEVERGEAVGIIGRNGSGKSTLLQVICGTLRPTSGAVSVIGRVSPLLELGSGFNPEFTGRENVYLSAAVLGLSRRETDMRFEEITQFASIGEYLERPVKTYSSGMFARLAFSVAVHVDPDILVVDEALSVGDLGFQQKCIKRMLALRKQGVTLLFVSHDPYQVKAVCQRALYLRAGRLVNFGEAGSVVDAYLADLHSGAGFECGSEEGVAPEERPTVKISTIRLLDAAGEPLQCVRTGDSIRLSFSFERLCEDLHEPLSFVFNLYRADGLYVCGATTLMDGHKPFAGMPAGRVTIRFPSFPLLAGRYHWRVAVNDEHGLSVLAKAEGVCPFVVEDGFKAVGAFDLPRKWQVEHWASM